MWNDETGTLYYQVGIGEGNAATAGDHDIWRLPQADDGFGGEDPLYRYIRDRPVFRAAPAGSPVSPNLAGRDAAAFALCFEVFHASDPMLADRCLKAGEHIFALADTTPQRPPAHGDPLRLLSREANGATTSSSARRELALALRGRRLRCRPDSRTPNPPSTSAQAAEMGEGIRRSTRSATRKRSTSTT